MTPLPRRLPQAENPADAAVVDATLALLRGAHPRDGLEQRILARLDDRERVPHPERTGVPGTRSWRAGVGSEGWVFPFVSKTPLASAAFGVVAVAALGAAVVLAHRPRPTVFIPTSPAPVLSQKVESSAVQTAGATTVAKSPIRPHTHGRTHRVGRAVHERTTLPPSATSPRQVDLQAPQPLAAHR
jgi:hypothetical protein